MRVFLLALLFTLIGSEACAQSTRVRRRPRPTVPRPGPSVKNDARPAEPAPAPPGPAIPLPDPLGSSAPRIPAAEIVVPDPSWFAPGTTPPISNLTRVARVEGAPPAMVPDRPVPRRWAGTVRLLVGGVQQPASLVRPAVPGALPFVPSTVTMLGIEAERRVWPWMAPYATVIAGVGQIPHAPIIRSLGFAPLPSYTMGSGLMSVGVVVPLRIGPLEPYVRGGGGYRATLVDFPALVVWQLSPTSDVGGGVRLRRGRWGLAVDARWMQSTFDAARLPVFRLPGSTISPIRESILALSFDYGLR